MNVNEIKAKAFDAVVTAYYSEKLCGAYVDAFVSLVNAFDRVVTEEPEKPASIEEVAEVKETKPVKKTTVKAESPSKKSIDKGKIAALYKAGWTRGQIAEELGVTTQTISYHLKNLGLDKDGDK